MNAVSAGKLGRRDAGVLVFEDRDDLGLGEAGLPHVGSFDLKGRDSTILHGSDYRGSFGPTGAETLNEQVKVPPLFVQPGELCVTENVCGVPFCGVTTIDCVDGET